MGTQQLRTTQVVSLVNRTLPPMCAVWRPRQRQFLGSAAAGALIEGLHAVWGCMIISIHVVRYVYFKCV